MQDILNYTTYQVAKFCGVSMPGVIRWIKDGKLTAFKTPGGHRRIKKQDLIQFMKQYDLPIPSDILRSESLKVLIVDDDAGILHAAKRVVSSLYKDAVLECAANGFEAGQKLENFHPDLVLLDLKLPGINGFQVCGIIKTNPDKSHIKVLLMTGYDNEDVREKVSKSGADGFLLKPFESAKLAAELSRLVERK